MYVYIYLFLYPLRQQIDSMHLLLLNSADIYQCVSYRPFPPRRHSLVDFVCRVSDHFRWPYASIYFKFKHKSVISRNDLQYNSWNNKKIKNNRVIIFISNLVRRNTCTIIITRAEADDRVFSSEMTLSCCIVAVRRS